VSATSTSIAQHVAIVPAKAHSTRCPEKNWRPFADGPCLTERTLAAVPRAICGRVILSTDRHDYTPTQDCEVHRRSAELATEAADVQDLLRLLIEEYGLHDATLWLLNPTAPFRAEADFAAIERLLAAGAPAVVSVTPIHGFIWRDGAPAFRTEGRRPNTQELGGRHALENGMFYVFRAADFLAHRSWYVPGVVPYVQDEARARIDIDTPADYAWAEQTSRLLAGAAAGTGASRFVAGEDLGRAETLAVEQLIVPPHARHVTLLANHLRRYFLASEALEIGGDDTVLDASCGKGYGTHVLGQVAGRVTGLDISEDNLATAERLFGAERVRFAHYDAYFAERPAGVDKIVCIETFEHVPQPEIAGFVERLLGALRPGGAAFFTYPLGPDGPSAVNPYHLNEPRLETAHALLAGRFREVRYRIARRRDSYGQETAFCCATLRGYLGGP
jgi:CMP-N-acetylneuraminic acid synthetase